MAAQFEAFMDHCSDQRLALDPFIVEAAALPFKSGGIDYGPDQPVFRAIARAASLLRNRPELPLATGDGQLDPAAFQGDVPLGTLATMVNCSITPQPEEPGVPYIADNLKGERNVCELAEIYWTGTLKAGREPADEPLAQLFYQGSELVLARKVDGVQTGLTFAEQINISGVVYPAGSIISLWARDDVYHAGRLVLNEPGMQRLAFGSVRRASFLRLSAFALPQAQRDAYNISNLGYGHTLTELRDWAQASQKLPA